MIVEGNPLENYDRIKQEGVYGEALTNVFGGGTVNSEWEVLTGFSSLFLLQEQIPYQNCVKRNCFSVVRLLEEQGYKSFAIHPYLESNYNRNQAYQKMGIDYFLSEKDFSDNTERIRGYISDREVYKRALEEGEKVGDLPWLGVIVTMQNHGGYGWNENELQDLVKNYPIELNMEQYTPNQKKAIQDLTSGIYATDVALGELVDKLRLYQEPTLLIFFGDHMSDAIRDRASFLDESGLYDNSDELNRNFERHRVPFLIWSNYKSVNQHIDFISLSQLLPTAFNMFGLYTPPFWNYLFDLEHDAGVNTVNFYLDQNNKLYRNIQENVLEEEKYSDYELLQYDQLFGENYYDQWFH